MNPLQVFIERFFAESASLWTAMAPYILLGLGVAGLLNGFLGSSFVKQHLGGHGLLTVLKAAILGVPLPVCSCGVIPLAASLKKQGAGHGATLSFLVSTPTSGVDSILATYALLGTAFAVFRPLAALVGGLLVGSLYILTSRSKPGEEPSQAPGTKAEKADRSLKGMLRYGFIDLTEDIGTWLILGVAIGGFLSVVIPQDFVLRFLPTPSVHYLIMLVLGIPLYVCATGSIPIAAAFIAKGFSPGSALVFLIAGPATNAVTLSFVRSKLGKKAFVLYLTSIGVIALASGWLFDRLFTYGAGAHHLHHHGEGLPGWLSTASGIVLLFLVLLKWMPRKKGETVLGTHDEVWQIEGMSCKHCQATITESLVSIEGIKALYFDLSSGTMEIDGHPDVQAVEKAISNAGAYTPKKIK
jgi:uncharacterized membrane protein YraQ (UPF0718 family)/copper chaperone CopZ